MSSNVTKPSDFVILVKENDYKHVHLIPGRQMSLFKEKFFLDGVIGQKYGSYFKVCKNQLVKVPYRELPSLETPDNGDIEEKNNRDLQGCHSNQKLSKQDIMTLRKQGTSGDQIVDQLVENSSTFQAKTEFSQQKYIRRKQKRHVFIVCLLPLTTRHIHDMYFNRGPSKLSYLRMDTLAQILTYANIHAGNNVIIYETCAGIVVRGILERMGGFGRVVHLFSGTAPSRPTMDINLALPSSLVNILYDFPVNRVADLYNEDETEVDAKLNNEENRSMCDSVNLKRNEEVTRNEAIDVNINLVILNNENNIFQDLNSISEGIDNKYLTPETTLNSNRLDELNRNDDEQKEVAGVDQTATIKPAFGKRQNRDSEAENELRNQRRELRLNRIHKTKVAIKQRNTNALIIAGKVNPITLVTNLLEFLAPSSPIVIFCPNHEPLVDCYQVLKSKGILALKITETFYRGYQFLKNRTHPQVLMNSNGGYLLTGIKVEDKS